MYDVKSNINAFITRSSSSPRPKKIVLGNKNTGHDHESIEKLEYKILLTLERSRRLLLLLALSST